MLRVDCYNCATGTITPLAQEDVPAMLQRGDVLLWVDLQHPHEEELTWLQDTFHFHPLAMEDIHNHRQRAKMDRYDGYDFFVARTISYHPHSHNITSHQLNLFVSTNYVVTVHGNDTATIEHVRHRWEETVSPHEPSAFLCYLMLDVVVDDYFPIVDRIGDTIDEIDTRVFNDPNAKDLHAIFTLRRSLLEIRKILGPLRDALNELTRAEKGLLVDTERTRLYFMDVFDHVLRLTDFVDTYRDMLSGSLEAYQSAQGNRLNTNMQRLTVAATVLATGTVITGFYGMNVRGLFINSPWPYTGYIILTALVVITLVEILIFRKKGWL